MDKNHNGILMFLSIFVIAIFLTGCSQNAATKTTDTTTNTNNVENTPSTASGSTPDTSTNPSSTTDASSETIKDITIEASNFDFIQTGPAINKGDKVRITFTVTSGTHSLVLSGYNIEFTPMTAGKTQSATFTADKSGTFEYNCNNFCGSGHSEMIGKLVVN